MPSREPMLRSRIFHRVHITPLSSEQVSELISSFHPIYAGVAREVLLRGWAGRSRLH